MKVRVLLCFARYRWSLCPRCLCSRRRRRQTANIPSVKISRSRTRVTECESRNRSSASVQSPLHLAHQVRISRHRLGLCILQFHIYSSIRQFYSARHVELFQRRRNPPRRRRRSRVYRILPLAQTQQRIDRAQVEHPRSCDHPRLPTKNIRRLFRHREQALPFLALPHLPSFRRSSIRPRLHRTPPTFPAPPPFLPRDDRSLRPPPPFRHRCFPAFLFLSPSSASLVSLSRLPTATVRSPRSVLPTSSPVSLFVSFLSPLSLPLFARVCVAKRDRTIHPPPIPSSSSPAVAAPAFSRSRSRPRGTSLSLRAVVNACIFRTNLKKRRFRSIFPRYSTQFFLQRSSLLNK